MVCAGVEDSSSDDSLQQPREHQEDAEDADTSSFAEEDDNSDGEGVGASSDRDVIDHDTDVGASGQRANDNDNGGSEHEDSDSAHSDDENVFQGIRGGVVGIRADVDGEGVIDGSDRGRTSVRFSNVKFGWLRTMCYAYRY